MLLNRVHRCAVSTLGCAHVVADQQGVEFDEQRVVVVRDKYFPAYLLALLQRLALAALLRRAGAVRQLPADDVPFAVEALRETLLDVAVRGNDLDVSTRNAVQRCYELARTGNRVAASWNEVRNAVSDLDARIAASRQAVLATKSEKHLEAIQRVQGVVHLLEYVLVAVYAAHFDHMLHFTEGGALHVALMCASAAPGCLVVFLIDRRASSGRAAH